MKLDIKDTTDQGEATSHFGDWLADLFAANCIMEEGRRGNWPKNEFATGYDEEISGTGVVIEEGGKLLWIYLYIHNVKWKTYTPTGETAIE